MLQFRAWAPDSNGLGLDPGFTLSTVELWASLLAFLSLSCFVCIKGRENLLPQDGREDYMR